MSFSTASVKGQAHTSDSSMATSYSPKQPITAGILLGIGLGGFFDGIVLHQLLQWHHMVSSWYPPVTLENFALNTLWDGLFHTVTYAFTIVGVVLLWRSFRRHDRRWSLRTLLGCLVLGWGAFNLADGIIDHHILGVHHIRDDLTGTAQLAWDIGFLIFGTGLVLTGWLLLRQDKARRDRVATFLPAQKANPQK
jgi:uncharacterized membrane protein